MAEKDNKVTCQFCEKEYSKSGIANHEKACPQNPENAEEEVVEVPVEVVAEAVQVIAEVTEAVVEPVAEIVEAVEEEPKGESIKLAEKIDCYIGDRYYRFNKGEEAVVPAYVKDVLKRAGMLEAL